MRGPVFMLKLCDRISRTIHKDLTQTEIREIEREANHASNAGKKLDIIASSVARQFLTKAQKKSASDRDNFDIKAYQVAEIGTVAESNSGATNEIKADLTDSIDVELSSILALKEKKLMQLLFNPTARYKRKLIVLDSINQVDLFNGTGVMQWNIAPSRDFIAGNVNTNVQIKDIVGMRLMPPRWDFYSALKYMNNPVTRWTILVEEFRAQSFIYPTAQGFTGPLGNNTVGQKTRRFHFMFSLSSESSLDTSGVGRYYDMTTHNYNQGYFWFRKPITYTSSTMTLSFGMPFNECWVSNQKYTGNIGIHTPGNYLAVYFPYADLDPDYDPRQYPYVFDTVLLSGFTTANPVADQALISSINGHYFSATGVSGPPRYCYFPAIDLTGITLAPNSTMSVYVPYFRMIYPIELIYLEDEDIGQEVEVIQERGIEKTSYIC